MRIKTILSLIAFSATFILSVLFVGVPKDNVYSRFTQISGYEQDRQNIQTLLQQDIGNGSFRDDTIMNLDEIGRNSQTSFAIAPYADAVEDYVENSESIDATDLPSDFQAAWFNHMDAWREHADFLNRIKASGRKYNVDGREINQFSINPNDWQTLLSQGDKINLTWHEVLRVGRKHGVFISGH